MNRKIAIVMGSDSDFELMKSVMPILHENEIDYDFRVISAHRTPWIAAEFAKNAKENGYDLFIAAAGMSAHLPGVLAAFTGVPVIGVPVKSRSSAMDGMDALHSIIQMPPGIPVVSVGIDNAVGAAKLAVKMINCRLGDKPVVKIVYDENEVKEADLKKVIKALAPFGPGHEVTEIKDFNTSQGDFFAVINLTDSNVEKIMGDTAKQPIIEVPLKALTDGFGDTSSKIYNRTGSSDAVGFVGVNSYENAGLMLGRIMGIHDLKAHDTVISEHAKLAAAVIEKDTRLRSEVDEAKSKY